MAAKTKYVYSAECGGRIKIGVAGNVKSRLSGLRAGASSPLTLIGAVPGGFQLEKSLHKKLEEYRLHGEWFQDCPDVRGAIQAAMAQSDSVDLAPPTLAQSKAKFGEVCKTLWPNKAAAHLAFISGRDERTAKRWLAGEFEPPICVALAVFNEIFPKR